MTATAFTVSVIIPAYNAARTVGRAVTSAFRQTLAPLEVLVIDDGSTDDTGAVVHGLGEAVRYIHQDNGGAASARNRGLVEARGEYVAFLDADDEWLPHHLEEAARVFEVNPGLPWFCAAFERRTEGQPPATVCLPEEAIASTGCVEDYFAAQARHGFAWTGTMVIRKSLVDEVGGFDVRMRRGQDQELWFRIALQHPRIGYAQRIAAIYWPGPMTTMRHTRLRSGAGLRWIRELDGNAARAGDPAVPRSRPLILAWVGRLIRRAIQEEDQPVLAAIGEAYRREVSWGDRALLLACRVVPLSMMGAVARGWSLAARYSRHSWKAISAPQGREL